MALDLTGIGNENEFYTHHYLTAILENDLKGLFSSWEERAKQTGEKPPYDRFARLYRDYFPLRNRMERLSRPEEIIEAQRAFIPELLATLGYTFSPSCKELDSGAVIPIVAEIQKKNGAPELWILETVSPLAENADPLESFFSPVQYDGTEEGKRLTDTPLTDIVTKQVFSLSEPPRWILGLNMSQLVLLDRSKWSERRFLRFDLAEILDRRIPATLRATAALLHRESVCPEEGVSLLDTLDENSHKHAFAVSEDLKYSAREAVELLGNEALYYIRTVRKGGIYGKDMAEQLTRECLRYLYRLLFLFYIEARQELGYAPLNSDEYRTGYSLEQLRDLELQPLMEESSQNGYFIHDSLQILFLLIFDGFNYEVKTDDLAFEEQRPVFRLFPLNSHLFDPEKTPLLNGVKFRNSVLQKVIKLLSLSRSGNRRGRISYAQLGINQLGAVYEGLLSYSGFFAETDLYEVKKAGTEVNALEAAFFVNAEDFPQYDETERVYNSDGTLKIYPRGTFIYRLAGRNREKTASYYTPEVLTRCLVKYALKELLQDKTADGILKLTLCEPAMGSAAFLNEAINQLAEAYLERKQKETGDIIGHDDYRREKQKVKAFLADNNVFGVDLNPVAVELAEVSLWLNAMYIQDNGAPPVIPWFGNQLVCGNSLIGARRQVFATELLEENRKGRETWLDVVPERIPLGANRPEKTVWHFLVPDAGMANYTDRVVRGMAKEETQQIKQWRKDFIRPFRAGEIATLVRLSGAADKLWKLHVGQCREVRRATREGYRFFGYDDGKIYPYRLTTKEKDDRFNRLILSVDEPVSSPFQRLKLVMDYWCALWFWPLQKAAILPTRDEFLMDLSLILEGSVYESTPASGEQLSLLPDDRPTQAEIDFSNEFGNVNVDALWGDGIERFALVRNLAEKHRFHHWELVFADLFADRGGFDLVLGNPPWIKIEWNEGGLLGDYDPLFILRKFSAAQLAILLEETIEKRGIRDEYLHEYAAFEGTQNFLNALQNYPILRGTQSNLYKCFLPQAWMIGTEQGVSGFLHPEGVYDDPNGGNFRKEIYRRLRYHFQFQNELNLFGDVDHHVKFSVNIGRAKAEENAAFSHIANLFSVATVDASFRHGGNNPVGGIKDEENHWNVAGHRDRIIAIGDATLRLFADLYDEHGTPALQARLPVIHSQQVVEVLRKFAAQPKRLGDLKGEFFSTEMWHETNAQKEGIIKRATQFAVKPESWILSGPHFYVGNPLNKTPRSVCRLNSDYDSLDLTMLPDDYLPRTNYAPACDADTYLKRIPTATWGSRALVTNNYRIVVRKMLSQAGERTFISCIIPPHTAHINGCISYTIKSLNLVAKITGLVSTLPYDFFLKSTGISNFGNAAFESLSFPYVSNSFIIRTLMLNCLTTHYTELWASYWDEAFRQDSWTKADSRLNQSTFVALTAEWQRFCALRTDYERRQALVEIDVLAAMSLGLTLDELCAIYRIQFPVLCQNEKDTWYDQNGRIVFTCSKGLPGVGFSRPEWNDIKDMKSGTVYRTIVDDTLPNGPRERTITYTAPFDRCDREADYAIAWTAFEARGNK